MAASETPDLTGLETCQVPRGLDLGPDPCPNCGRLNRPGARFCASCQSPLDATDAGISTGQLLDDGNYRVVRPLGRGGMGAVYLVAQTKAFDRLAV